MRASLARHGRLIALSCTCYNPRSSLDIFAVLTFRRPDGCSSWSPRISRRSFIDQLFKEPPRKVREPEYEPGWLEIMNWRSRMLEKVRPPPRQELVDAWRLLMKSKLERRIPLNRTQAIQCCRLLRYLFWPGEGVSLPPEQELTPLDLDLARRLLLEIEPKERGEEHIEFAKLLHEACKERVNPQSKIYLWASLLRALSRYGAAEEAAKQVLTKLEYPNYRAKATLFDEKDGLVLAVARGLAREGKEATLRRLAVRASRSRETVGAAIQSLVICFLSQRDDDEGLKREFLSGADMFNFRVEAFRAIAAWARRRGWTEWAKAQFLPLLESRPRKEYWDVIMQSRLLAGQGIQVVEEIMGVMVHADDKMKVKLEPDEDTLNGLLRVAVEIRNPQLGDQIMDLGASKGIKPNGETCLTVWQLRMATGDLSAAKAAFQQVKHREAWLEESKPELIYLYRELMNSYLLLLSAQPAPDFDLVRELVDAADEDQVLLDPETVAALCLRLLENDAQMDVMDLLSAYSFLFSEAQRMLVQKALMTFCLNPSTSTARAWDAYQLLSQFFPEMTLERRTELMHSFFNRKRPDMAALVFGHMRQHRNKDFHPRLETYLGCLEGFARHPDAKGLGMIHNMLKMDTTVQPDTNLNTAMMLAYTGCGRPRTALRIWEQITLSPKGPSYASLEAVFWALEKDVCGPEQASEIWARIERLDLEVPPRVYVAYVGAMTSTGGVDQAKELLKGMASVVGSGPDSMALAVAHNALPGQELQEEFRKWAESEFPGAWAGLNKVKRRLDENHLCQIRIDRDMRAVSC
ncbi:Complex I intermediate-associated protein 84, mitochondrial [Ophiocordyceps camponoti-floridani]|uniref:Complex I intermediate-associated protein 84, mitochondrial n=1 Tax=Ophiocordyceps camponoti-floridani TaxID=2030778 RepID=A0A8H4VD54_9HYPO|nr:Complex I intermediate-associated protein 84, mitochondrial [Ophiocordyceps camponoti-floridani]